HLFAQLGARLGRRLQEPQHKRIHALLDLVVVASLIVHAGEHSMASGAASRGRTIRITRTLSKQHKKALDRYSNTSGKINGRGRNCTKAFSWFLPYSCAAMRSAKSRPALSYGTPFAMTRWEGVS